MKSEPLRYSYRARPDTPLMQRVLYRVAFGIINTYLDHRDALEWEFDSIKQFQDYRHQIKSIDHISFRSVIILDKTEQESEGTVLEVTDFSGKTMFTARHHTKLPRGLEDFICRAMTEDNYRIAQSVPHYENVEIIGSLKDGQCYIKYLIRDDESQWERNCIPRQPIMRRH